MADYRLGQISRLSGVEEARDDVSADDVLAFGFVHIAIATWARWRANGVGRHHTRPIPLDPGLPVFTPDDLMAGEQPDGRRIVIYDDDHCYMGGVLAEQLDAAIFTRFGIPRIRFGPSGTRNG